MSPALRKLSLTLIAVSTLALAPLTLSHFDDKEMQQSYRQSWYALVAFNFGPMVASVKGEIPWDQAAMERWSNDLAALATMNVMRGYTDGSDKGTTRAKPEIWQNLEDFESKLGDMKSAATELQQVVAGGDREAIANQVGATGKACKACHDEYKSEDYLY
jgi:cytochrome c556